MQISFCGFYDWDLNMMTLKVAPVTYLEVESSQTVIEIEHEMHFT